MASRHRKSAKAEVIAVGSSEGGRGCLVTTKDFFGLYILFINLVTMLCVRSESCSIDAGIIEEEEGRGLTWSGDGSNGDTFTGDDDRVLPIAEDDDDGGTKSIGDDSIGADEL